MHFSHSLSGAPGRAGRITGGNGKQRGQAIVLVLLLTIAGVLIALSLVNTGILTSEKMQLQNAADATAFSVSTLEARDLNFAAYTNRAMVANEVAIGQMVGLMSWAVMANSTPEYLDLWIGKPLNALMGTPAAFIPIAFQTVLGVLRTVTRAVRSGVRTFATTPVNPFSIPAMRSLNKFYSVAQQIMHMATLSMSAGTLFDMIDANADGGKLSLFGYLALARHFTTYYAEISGGKETFVGSYSQDSTSDAQKAGMQRLAALVNASRDPFSKDRDGGWSIPIIPTIRIHFNVRLPKILGGGCLVCVDISYGVSVDRNGGSDLRYTTRSKKQLYNWSAVDTLAGNMDFQCYINLLGVKLCNFHERPGLPFGIGGAQVAKTTSQMRAADMWPHFAGGEVPDEGYGKSPVISPVAWLWSSPVPGDGGPYFAVNRNNLDRKYTGLPNYHDTKAGPDPVKIDANLKFGWEAPYLLIALYKPMQDISQSSATGRFSLNSGAAHDELDVLGKSEVYFSRPNDLGYFARADGKTELANAFNPYWDARLVDTSYIDRIAVISMSQRQPWALQNVAEPLQKFLQLLSFIPGLP